MALDAKTLLIAAVLAYVLYVIVSRGKYGFPRINFGLFGTQGLRKAGPMFQESRIRHMEQLEGLSLPAVA